MNYGKLFFPLLLAQSVLISTTHGNVKHISTKRLEADEAVEPSAAVGLELITSKDITERVKLITMFCSRQLSKDSLSILRSYTKKSLIDEKLRIMYAKKFAPPPFREWVAAEEVNGQFEAIAQSNGLTDEGFKKMLAEHGVNPKTLYDQIYARLTWSAYIYARYSDKVSFLDKEIDERHRKTCNMLKKRAYGVERFFAPFNNEHDKIEARKLVDAVLELIHAGIDFQSIARQFSNGAEAISGGDLGYIADGQLPFKKENEALKQMKQGEVRVVEVNHGFSILKLNASVSTKDDNGEIFSVRYILIPLSDSPDQSEVEAKLGKVQALASGAKNAKELISLAEKENLKVTSVNDIPSEHIAPELKSLLNDAKNGISKVVCTPREILCACILKRKKIIINMPTKEVIAERMIDEKLSVLTEQEMCVARKTIRVEDKE